jgi:hypothetical protein
MAQDRFNDELEKKESRIKELEYRASSSSSQQTI